MYNTIEVSKLDISKVNIKYLKGDGFYSVANEGMKHVKILPYLSIVQSTEGSYDISLGNKPSVQTGEGGFFIAPAHEKQTIGHHANEQTKKMSARWLFLNVEINDAFQLDELYRFPVVVNDDLNKQLNCLFDAFFESDNIWKKYSVCYEILGLLLLQATPVKLPHRSSISTAVAFMTQNYTKQITIEQLAKISHMSKSNFFASFKKQFGISPISYINRYRLSIAAEKLSESNLSVNEIAFSVGITDSLYFSKMFKKEYNMSPSQYRLMHTSNERR